MSTIETKQQTTLLYKKLYKYTKAKLNLDKVALVSAIKALQQYKTQQKDNQLFKDDYIYLTITLNDVPTKHTCRPLPIKLPFPIYTEAYNNQMCLIVKDPQRDWKDLIEKEGLSMVKKVIGISKLAKKFSTYEKKRMLLNSFDGFLCDIRIYKMLPHLLGREFYRKKKFPAPLKLKEPTTEIKKACDSSYIMMGNGPHYTLKVGRIRMKLNEIGKNTIASLYKLIPYLLMGGVKIASIQSITLKVEDSPELPFYSQLLKSEIVSYVNENK